MCQCSAQSLVVSLDMVSDRVHSILGFGQGECSSRLDDGIEDEGNDPYRYAKHGGAHGLADATGEPHGIDAGSLALQEEERLDHA